MRRSEPHLGPGVSVEVDWFGGLPDAHLSTFRAYSKGLEASFGMFSVSLNEAMTLREGGALAMSFQVSALVSGLCQRFTPLLEDILSSLEEHADAHGTTPSVEALNPGDYRSQRGLHSALTSALWSLALFSQHGKFLSKLRALRDMVNHIGHDICMAVEDVISRGVVVDSQAPWLAMAQGYFDLNTCLRESLVMLKCFLRVLPHDQLQRFQRTVANYEARRKTQTGVRVLRQRTETRRGMKRFSPSSHQEQVVAAKSDRG